MWPWSHLAVGYVAFSVFVRFGLKQSPSGRAALVLALATQLPDLIDKPLAWQFGLVSNGIGIAHSLLVGVPLAIGLGISLWASGRPELGGAFSIGYGSHVIGDLFFAGLFSRSPFLPSFLWPLSVTPAPAPAGFGTKVWRLLLDSRALLSSSTGKAYFLLVALLFLATLALWVYDGAPGLGPVRTLVRGEQ